MFQVEIYGRVRRAVRVEGRSQRAVAREFGLSRECLLIRSERRWSSARVIEALADVMVMEGIPEHLRSDNGPEFVAKELWKWLARDIS